MSNLNILCPSCKQRYAVEMPHGVGVHTVHCPYCSAPFDVLVTQDVQRKHEPLSGAEAVAAKVRRCEVASSVAWIVIGIVQCAMLYTTAAGVWNVVNAILALRNVKNITAHNPGVVPYFDQRKVWLIVLAVVNLVLGGVVGVVLVLLEWLLRDYVLRNRSAFENSKPSDFPSLFPYVQFSSALDDCVCERCRKLEGQVFPSDKAPKLPLHEGCRCVYLYLSEEEGRSKMRV